MTEDEAKKKWCPFARVNSNLGREIGWNRREGESFGHRENIGGETHCIGAKCMAWKETGCISGPVIERKRAMPMSICPDGWGYEPDDEYRASKGGDWVRRERGPATGYCGLAGAHD